MNNARYKKLPVIATAVVAAAVMALAGCGSSSSGSDSSSSGSSNDAFVLGALFPETGSLAYLGPAETSVFKLATNDINAAGGVLGKKITTATADVSDADHADHCLQAGREGL